MLLAKSRIWWPFRLDILEDANLLGEIRGRWFGTSRIFLDNRSYDIYHPALRISIMEDQGTPIARATEYGIGQFNVEFGGMKYRLEKRGWFSRIWVLAEGNDAVGSIKQRGLFGQNLYIDISDQIHNRFKFFVIWLTMYASQSYPMG